MVHYGNQGEGTKKEIFAIVDWLNLMTYDDDKGQYIPHSPYSLVRNLTTIGSSNGDYHRKKQC